jgi:dipeptidyl-peptidase 4
MTPNETSPLLQSYRRAARLTAPKLAAVTAGASVEGYWIDARHYFFLAERLEPGIGRVVSTPSIVDCVADRLEEVVPLAALANMIGEHSRESVAMEELAAAEFDMPNAGVLAVSLRGRCYLIDRRQQCVLNVSPSPETPALYSPDGRYACLVSGLNLTLRDRHSGVERPLTREGEPGFFYGQPSTTCLYAVTYRRRAVPSGMWSPDSQWFLTHRIDERAVPDLPLIQHAPAGGGAPVLHSIKMTTPGCQALPIATFVAIHIESGLHVEFADFPVPVVMPYLPFARTAWFSAPNIAWALRFDRYCQQVELIRFDLAERSGKIALSERVDSGYLDLHAVASQRPNIRCLTGSDEVIWFSERSGWGHLYLYDVSSGALKNAITRGEWLVRDIVHVDEGRRTVLLLAGGIHPNTDPARRSLCRVNLDGSGLEVLLSHDGDVFVPPTMPGGLAQDRPFRAANAQPGVSHGGEWCITQCGSVDEGNRTEIIELCGRRSIRVLASAQPGPDDPPARHFSALAADGTTRLYGVLFLPPDFDPTHRYPLIDVIYPGPQISWQPQSFRAIHSARATSLAALGFVTMMIDTRGTPIASRAFHQVGYGNMLEPQLADHAVVIRRLSQQHGFIDADRVGILGASAGGSATARALFKYGDIFKVGVSACGAHDCRSYFSQWSDKYRGPGDPKAWADQASGASAHELRGKLLLITGDMDENVHVGQTLSLVDALIRGNRDFDLLIVPNEGHAVLASSAYTNRRMWDYFARHLLGQEPPANFELNFDPHELARMSLLQEREVL